MFRRTKCAWGKFCPFACWTFGTLWAKTRSSGNEADLQPLASVRALWKCLVFAFRRSFGAPTKCNDGMWMWRTIYKSRTFWRLWKSVYLVSFNQIYSRWSDCALFFLSNISPLNCALKKRHLSLECSPICRSFFPFTCCRRDLLRLFFSSPGGAPSPQAASTWRASCYSGLLAVVKHWWPGRLARCSTPANPRSSTGPRSSTSTLASPRPTSANCLPRQRRSKRGWDLFFLCYDYAQYLSIWQEPGCTFVFNIVAL